MNLSALLIAGVPLAWLLPNHYNPWSSAWQDGWALALLCGAGLVARGTVMFDPRWMVALGIALISVGGQWLTGKILFSGDAWIVALYLLAFALAVGLGAAMIRSPKAATNAQPAVDAFAAGVLLAAMLSVAVALLQWTGNSVLALYGMDLRPGARPYGNVGQPNHLSSLLFLGLCAVLVLKESGRIGYVGFWAAGVWLVAGMVASGSRTGALQLVLLVVLAAARARHVSASARVPQVLGVLALFALGTALWPWVNDALLLTGGRAVTQQIDGGARGPLWLSLIDAAWREPWWGYGWQQMVLAQQAVAVDHAPLQRHFEHSHNVLFDLVLWTGLPVATAIVALSALALVRLVRALRDARALWLTAAVLGLLAHSMLEFPLEYAYFLVPAGLALGMASAMTPGLAQRQLPGWVLRVGAGGLTVLLGAVGFEYLQAEQDYRVMRMETSRIGTKRVESVTPEFKLLTQLSAFLEFARTEARPGMSEAELDRMRRVSSRFAYPPAMFRYALAAGLNGRPADAELTLRRLCHIHPQARCDEAREAWGPLQQRHPVLSAVSAP